MVHCHGPQSSIHCKYMNNSMSCMSKQASSHTCHLQKQDTCAALWRIWSRMLAVVSRHRTKCLKLSKSCGLTNCNSLTCSIAPLPCNPDALLPSIIDWCTASMMQQHGQMIKALLMSEEETYCEHEAADRFCNQNEFPQNSRCTQQSMVCEGSPDQCDMCGICSNGTTKETNARVTTHRCIWQ